MSDGAGLVFGRRHATLNEGFRRRRLAHCDTKVLQVVDSTPYSVELRALMTAKASKRCWDLRCYVRRGLLEFLAREHPEALPSVPVALQDTSLAPASRARSAAPREATG